MNHLANVLYFNAGMCSMWNFMRTTYVYDGLPAFYAMDVVALVTNVAIAWLGVRFVSKRVTA